ncbi:MAG: acyl-CoA dehydratase activase [Desulfuromonadales bacterium]|nr:acyl-CoA dehydratase activase [Desulfuromonadales bacterium]
MITAGIDVGSRNAKAAVIEDGKLLGTCVILTGYDAKKTGRQVYEEILSNLDLSVSRIDKVVSTGHGRNCIDFADKAMTEITCHAAGAYFLNPAIHSIIDIGGQDSKAIVLNSKGKVQNFHMNDKCAAGTGRFLEVMARTLEVGLDEFGALSLQADKIAPISSLCTVFAETEVVSLISKGERRENIIAGIHAAIGSRIMAMAKQVGIRHPIMMTGGVAKNIGVVKALEEALNTPIQVSEHAQVNGAIGAGLLASTI